MLVVGTKRVDDIEVGECDCRVLLVGYTVWVTVKFSDLSWVSPDWIL